MCYVFSISKPQNPRQIQTQIQVYFGAAQNYQTNPRLRFDSDTIFKIPFTTKAGSPTRLTSRFKEPGAGGTEPTPKGIASDAQHQTLGAPAPRLGRARSPAWPTPAGAGGRLGPSNFRKKRARPAAARTLKPRGAPDRRPDKRERVGGRPRGLPASPPPPLRSPPGRRPWGRRAGRRRRRPCGRGAGRRPLAGPRRRTPAPGAGTPSWGRRGGRPSRLPPPASPGPAVPLASQSAQYLLSSSRSSLARMAWCCSFCFCAFSRQERVAMAAGLERGRGGLGTAGDASLLPWRSHGNRRPPAPTSSTGTTYGRRRIRLPPLADWRARSCPLSPKIGGGGGKKIVLRVLTPPLTHRPSSRGFPERNSGGEEAPLRPGSALGSGTEGINRGTKGLLCERNWYPSAGGWPRPPGSTCAGWGGAAPPPGRPEGRRLAPHSRLAAAAGLWGGRDPRDDPLPRFRPGWGAGAFLVVPGFALRALGPCRPQTRPSSPRPPPPPLGNARREDLPGSGSSVWSA